MDAFTEQIGIGENAQATLTIHCKLEMGRRKLETQIGILQMLHAALCSTAGCGSAPKAMDSTPANAGPAAVPGSLPAQDVRAEHMVMYCVCSVLTRETRLPSLCMCII